jgi:uncharacterized membrane protein YjjP (DUF1212 family)
MTDPDDLQQFLLYLGSALTAAGEAVNEIESRLRTVAGAYGAQHARFAVLPTFIVVSLEPGRPATLEPTRQLRGVLRLDQIARIYQVLDTASDAAIAPDVGTQAILDAVDMPPRFGWLRTTIGHAAMTAGICLVLQPSWGDVALATAFGVIVGLVKIVGGRWRRALMLLPVACAFIVSAITFLLAKNGWVSPDIRSLIAPLVTFLPGAALTMGVIEISAGELVTGATRLVSGILQLLLLAFGIVAAAQAFGLPSARDLLAVPPQDLLGAWSPWLGVCVFAVGVYFYSSAPRGSFLGLFLVLGVAFVGQQLGNALLGGYLGGFVGAFAMTPTARIVERTRIGPPALVTFLPAFWLLVPGAIGLIGVTEYLASKTSVGVDDFMTTLGAMVSIAIGVLCAYPLVDSSLGAFQRLRARWGS